jgi:fibronectin type 3 domain-containing protein
MCRVRLKCGAGIICLVLTAPWLGCAGVSNGASTTSQPPTPPPAPSVVQLSWNPSSSSEIAGYNVYRSAYTNSCGSFSRINSKLGTDTTYSDSQVSRGSSYCYATTAVSTNNQESAYSNIVLNVQIPER